MPYFVQIFPHFAENSPYRLLSKVARNLQIVMVACVPFTYKCQPSTKRGESHETPESDAKECCQRQFHSTIVCCPCRHAQSSCADANPGNYGPRGTRGHAGGIAASKSQMRSWNVAQTHRCQGEHHRLHRPRHRHPNFYNPYNENIEAVYVFPLPSTATMDALTIRIGDHRLVGVMKTASEAYIVYNNAYHQVRQRREIAGLSEQESANIFTQSVENIKPHQEVHIEISYIDVLPYDMETYEFHFPMVVGPRYIHVPPISEKLELPDVSHPTQPVLKSDTRPGHDIRLSVSLDAGVQFRTLKL